MKNYMYCMIIPIKHTNNKGTYYFVSTYFVSYLQNTYKHIQLRIVVTPVESGRRDGKD